MLFDDVKTLFITAKCVLIIHFGIDTTNFNSITHHFLRLIVFFIYTTTSYVTLEKILINADAQDKCVKSTYRFYQIVGVICTYFNIINFVFKRKRFKQFLESIDNYNEQLGKTYNRINWKMKVYMISAIVGILINYSYLILRRKSFYAICYFFCYGANMFVSTILAYLIYILLREIKQQFSKINGDVLSADRLKIINLNKIILAMDYHYKIVDIAKNANDIFGISNATTLTYYFVCMTFSIHLLIRMILFKCFESSFYSCVFNVTFFLVQISILINSWNTLEVQVSNYVNCLIR